MSSSPLLIAPQTVLQHWRRRKGLPSPAERAEWLRRTEPAYATKLVDSADRLLLGELILPGTDGKALRLGSPPDWNSNPTADHEFIWSLNRMAHWKTLLRAGAVTGDKRFSQGVLREIADWIRKCPRPAIADDVQANQERFNRPTPWRSLEAGIRMYSSWASVVEFLGDDPDFAPLTHDIARSLEDHGEVLLRVCPAFWPEASHNHYLMECLGLLAAATIHTGMLDRSERIAHAQRELKRCLHAQLTGDGGQIEACPEYHAVCMEFFARAIEIGGDVGELFGRQELALLDRGMDYLMHATRPDGTTVPWGDSDVSLHPLTVASRWAMTTGDFTYFGALSQLAGPESAHLAALHLAWECVDPEAFIHRSRQAMKEPVIWQRLHRQSQIKQAVLRSDWSRDALSVFAACRTPIHNAHQHQDPGGFDFAVGSVPVLVDPGRFTYREGADRREFKSARSHNTLTIDGKEPFAYHHTWGYGPQESGDVIGHWEEADLIACVTTHDNYRPITAERLIALVEDRLLVVVDRVQGCMPGMRIERHWHFDTTDAHWDAITGTGKAHFTADKPLTVAIASTPGHHALWRESRVSTAIDIAHSSRILTLTDTASQNRHACAFVVIPNLAGDHSIRSTLAPQLTIAGSSLICDVPGYGRLSWNDTVSWRSVHCR